MIHGRDLPEHAKLVMGSIADCNETSPRAHATDWAMLNFHVYDVFTDTPYTGNPLAIVEQAGGLTTAQMQAMAREFNLSETIFLLDAAPAPEMPVRIFTPDHEMPFAGHPTVGCAVFLATHGHDDDVDTVQLLKEEAGDVPVHVVRQNGALRATFKSPVTPGAVMLDLPVETIAGALGLGPEALGDHAAHITTGGHPFVHIALRDCAALSKARVTDPAFRELAGQASTGSVYVYAPGDDADFEARMFAPLGGIGEDPATGSATALLAGQLLANGALGDGAHEFRICQGRDMGRLSHLTLSVAVAAGAITSVHVGGAAVHVSSGQIAPPA